MKVSPEVLAFRSRVLQAIRAFFIGRGYLEVETPVRLAAPAMEAHIDVLPSGDHFLRSSPELHMKRLLAGGMERIFQIGPCFRSGERGDLHHPEFTMLEWYGAGADYRDMLELTRALLAFLAEELEPGESGSPWWAGPWTELKVAEAFRTHAGWDPVTDFDADRFDLDLVERVEPALPRGPIALVDYPAPLAAMARCRGAVAERWELYLDGVEIANAYSELNDPVEQRRRFEAWGRERAAAGKEVYPLDEVFLDALAGMPEAGGVALGVDRLLTVLQGERSLDSVLPFRE